MLPFVLAFLCGAFSYLSYDAECLFLNLVRKVLLIVVPSPVSLCTSLSANSRLELLKLYTLQQLNALEL